MKLELTTLTPVHIGAGEEKKLSHITDYFLDEKNGEACYIDLGKLEQFMQDYPNPKQIVDDFVRRIRSEQAQEQQKYSVKTFLQDYGANPADFVRQRVPASASTIEQIKHQAIEPTIKNAGQPYIPGSSLKGAIRTALLYHEITNLSNEDYQRSIRKILQRNNHKEAKREFDELFGRFFGRYADDVFRFLRISDTSVLPATSLRLVHAERYRLVAGRSAQQRRQIPMNYETIAPGTVAQLELHCIAKKDYHRSNHLKPYFYENSEDHVLALSNTYSLAFVQHEIEALKSHAALATVHTFYQNELLPQLQNPGEGEAILSLGRGKTYFNNSIGMAFGKNELQQIRQLFRLGQNRRTKRLVEPFPISRTVIVENNQAANVLGWIKLRRID